VMMGGEVDGYEVIQMSARKNGRVEGKTVR
jgi:hypothetical protein